MFEGEELQYPVDWHFKIITIDIPGVVEHLTQVLVKHGINDIPTKGNKSSGGKYISYRVTVTVNNREHWDLISKELNALECVKYLL